MVSLLRQQGSEETFSVVGGSLAAVRKAIGLGLSRNSWNSWREKSANRRIFAAMVTVAGLTLAVKIISTIKEIVIAHEFGVSDGLDALLIAYLIPSFAISLVAGSFNAALIPTYIQVREQQGREAAQRLFSTVMVLAVALLIVVSITAAFLSGYFLPILGSGFSPQKLALTRKLFFIVLPTFPLTGLFAIWAAILNARERFLLAAIAPAFTPLVVILLVYAYGRQWGIYAFAIATLLGAAVEAVFVMYALKQQSISPFPKWHGITAPFREVRNQYMPMVAGAVMMGGTGLVDQSMAAMLRPGSVSILNYGNKISAVVVAIGTMAVSSAVLPQFSRMVAAGSWTDVQSTIKTYTRLIFLVTVPVSTLMIIFAPSLVKLLFQRGAFNPSDTFEVASVQSLYILQLPFCVSGMLLVRLISALRANGILMWGTMISFVLNITLDYVFMKRFGVAGIALATTVVYVASLLYLRLMSSHLLRRRLGDVPT